MFPSFHKIFLAKIYEILHTTSATPAYNAFLSASLGFILFLSKSAPDIIKKVGTANLGMVFRITPLNQTEVPTA